MQNNYGSLGEWFLLEIGVRLPGIGFILLIIFSCIDDENNQHRKNWARANLIMRVVGFFVLMVFIILCIMLGLAEGISEMNTMV